MFEITFAFQAQVYLKQISSVLQLNKYTKCTNVESAMSVSHHQVLSTLFGRVEEESTEEWDPHAVT